MEFIEVESVENKSYKGSVYDLGVKTDHTYTINDYSVHNSAAGSIICYLIGITNIDPLKHDLMFERFLDPARDDLPDIDTDFEPRIRDAVVDYMIKRFGRENTANIGTYGMLKTKSAIQDVARVFGIPAAETMAVTKYLDIESENDSIKEHEDSNPELKTYLNKWQDKGYEIRFFVEAIRGSARNLSMHAAGLLVSSVNLAENIALMQAKKGVITAWQESGSVQELSSLGYAKMDILGLQNLQVMNDAAKLIKQRHGIEIDWDVVNLDDPAVYENIIQPGDAMGLFQFEAGFVINMLRNIKPQNFEQFAAISALLRPGPLHMGMDKEFARRINGIADDEGHVWSEDDIPEEIRSILAPTKGILTYQEQYMKIAEKIGGFSVKETNKLRKDLTKGGKIYDTNPEIRKKIDGHKKKFLEHASIVVGDKEANDLWNLIFSFAQYGFNKCIYFKETVQDKDRGIITLEEVQQLVANGESVVIKSANENGDNIWVDVVDVHDNGIKDLVEVEMEDGRTIKCTLNHKFKTPEGMLPLQEIIFRDLDILEE